MTKSDTASPTEDAWLRQAALAYVIALHRDLTQENGAPILGTQNQAVAFILADPELRRAVAEWASQAPIGEATTAPPGRLPQDAAYVEIRTRMEQIMASPVFETPGRYAR